MGPWVVLSIDGVWMGGSVRWSAAAQPPEGEVVAPVGERVHAVGAERPVAGDLGLRAYGWVTSKPVPSSLMVIARRPPVAATSTVACVAWACLMALLSASRTMRYRCSSTLGSRSRRS